MQVLERALALLAAVAVAAASLAYSLSQLALLLALAQLPAAEPSGAATITALRCFAVTVDGGVVVRVAWVPQPLHNATPAEVG